MHTCLHSASECAHTTHCRKSTLAHFRKCCIVNNCMLPMRKWSQRCARGPHKPSIHNHQPPRYALRRSGCTCNSSCPWANYTNRTCDAMMLPNATLRNGTFGCCDTSAPECCVTGHTICSGWECVAPPPPSSSPLPVRSRNIVSIFRDNAGIFEHTYRASAMPWP